MKRFLAPLALLAVFQAPQTLAGPAQTDPTETVRRAIDDACGDSWCEGDYNFTFNQVVLKPQTATTDVHFTLSYQIPTEGITEEALKEQSFDLTCTIEGYGQAQEIMSHPYSLNWDFYKKLDACIEAHEHRLRGE